MLSKITMSYLKNERLEYEEISRGIFKNFFKVLRGNLMKYLENISDTSSRMLNYCSNKNY